MSSKLISRFCAGLLVLCSLAPEASACTDIRVKAKDGAIVIGRSMEWAIDMKSQLKLIPRGQIVQSTAPGGTQGLKWTSKYGFLSVNGMDIDFTLDGLNEKGLSFGGLWMPGSQYQNVSSDESAKALSIQHIGKWILGNFSDVGEVESALSSVKVWAPSLSEVGGTPTLHFSVHDASGKSIVIEFVDHKMYVHHNPNGVMTNAPTFDWHLTNLRTYLNITPITPETQKLGQLTLSPTGQGAGFLGVPGDYTPPSRFVRATALVSFADVPADSHEAVLLAQHIMNSVDIPKGVIRTASGDKVISDYTQWILLKDLTKKTFCFRAYNDFALHSVELSGLDFNEGAKSKSFPIGGETLFGDATELLRDKAP